MRKIFSDANVLGTFLLLGFGVAGHAMLETARDALFLKILSPGTLPWAYITVAAIAGTVVLLVSKHQHRFSHRKLIAGTYLASAAVTLAFYALFNSPVDAEYVAFALYVWVGVYITFLISSVWLLISALFSIDRAKESFGVIAAGGSLGAIAGSAGAAAITSQLQHTDLVLPAAAAIFALGAILPFIFRLDPVTAPPEHREPLRFLAELQRNNYLRSIAGLALFSTVAVTALDWLFKATVAVAIPADKLGSFFALFYLVANIAALLTQILLLRFFFRLLGAIGTLFVFPAIVLIGSAFILSAAGFFAVIGLKLAEAAFKNSLHKPAVELLYVPVHDHLRKKFKLVLDLISLRGGQALASLSLLFGALWIDTTIAAVAIIVLGTTASLVILSRLRPKYIKLFRDYLLQGRIETAMERPKLDLLSIEAILDSLNSDNDSEVIAALQFLESEGKPSIIPGLILFHPSERVVLAALEIFIEHPRRELKNIALRLLSDPRERVRVGALRLLTHFKPPRDFLRTLASGADRALVATATIEMVILGYSDRMACDELMEQLIAEADNQGLIDLCDAIALWRNSQFNPLLAEIYGFGNTAVKQAALRALAGAPQSDYLDLAEQAYLDFTLRPQAEKLFVARGPAGFDRLISMMHSEEHGHAIRIAIPASLGRFDFATLQPRLLAALVETSDGAIAYKLLRVLGRKRHLRPDAPLQTKLLDELLERELRRAGEYLTLASELNSDHRFDDTIFGMLFELIMNRAEESLERLFRIFQLRYSGGDFEQMYYALTADREPERANAEELLIHSVSTHQSRRVVYALSRLKSLRSATSANPTRGELLPAEAARLIRARIATFRRLLRDESAAVRALAAYFVGSARVTELVGEVRAAAHSDSEAINETFTTAIALLDAEGAGA